MGVSGVHLRWRVGIVFAYFSNEDVFMLFLVKGYKQFRRRKRFAIFPFLDTFPQVPDPSIVPILRSRD